MPFTVANIGELSERGAGSVVFNFVDYTGDYVVATTSTAGVAYATFLQSFSGASWEGLPSSLITASSAIRIGFTFTT